MRDLIHVPLVNLASLLNLATAHCELSKIRHEMRANTLKRSALPLALALMATPVAAQETIENRLNAGGEEWRVTLDCAGLFGAFDFVETKGDPFAVPLTESMQISYLFQILTVRLRKPGAMSKSEIVERRVKLNPELGKRVDHYTPRVRENIDRNGHLYRGNAALLDDVSFCMATMIKFGGSWPFGRP